METDFGVLRKRLRKGAAIVATPIDLRRVVEILYPTQRVRYELQEIGQPTLKDVLGAKFGLYRNSGDSV